MATFNVSILQATLPSANDDYFIVLPNTMKLLNVLSNDFLGTQPTIISIEIPPNNGIVNIVGNNIEYTPSLNYVGLDTFYYKITDNNGDFDIAKVNINIQ